MTSLINIELFLNIEIGDKILNQGLKSKKKNQFYRFINQYLIVKLTQEKWCIMPTDEKSDDLLRKNVFFYSNGYARNKTNGMFHVLLMDPEDGLVCDHINTRRYDNRFMNLRIVTQKINNQNKSISSANTSGTTGVTKVKMGNNDYYQAQITDNNNIKLRKLFSITKLGEVESKRQAILQRMDWKVQYNYLGA